jgi:hypothetical protein
MWRITFESDGKKKKEKKRRLGPDGNRLLQLIHWRRDTQNWMFNGKYSEMHFPLLHPLRLPSKSSERSRRKLASVQAEGGFWRVLWDMMTDVKAVGRGDEREAFRTALWLAFFNQAMASSAIVNYAPRLLRDSGIRSETVATLLTSTVTAAKVSPPSTSSKADM